MNGTKMSLPRVKPSAKFIMDTTHVMILNFCQVYDIIEKR